MIFYPGRGWEIRFDGTFMGKRYFDLNNMAELKQFFIGNFCINKKINKNLEFSVSFYNIFNQKYYYWDGYLEPDLISAGGIKYYW